MVFNILSSSCPLLLSSIGALFSEFAGVLALFLEGLICLGGFLSYFFTVMTGNLAAGIILSVLCCCILCCLFSFLVEKFKAHVFIAGIAINLLFAFLTSFLSVQFFGTRGVLTSEVFANQILKFKNMNAWLVVITALMICGGILFIAFTKQGLNLRVTGYNSEVLRAKGGKPEFYRCLSWGAAGVYGCIAGSMLVMKISSFVPNISSGRGWMALAAVYLGKKKGWKISIAVLVFAAADYFATHVQNVWPAVPSSVLLALPYFVMLLLILVDKKD